MKINEREAGRGIVHILFVIAFIVLILFDILKAWHLIVFILASFVLALLNLVFELPFVSFFLRNFERNDAKLPGKNFIAFLIGIFLAFTLFSKDICLASIAIMTFADPISHFVGMNFGRISVFGKNIEGHFAGLIIGSLFAMMFVEPIISIIGAFFGVLAELIAFRIRGIKIDDDLLIPIVAGLAMVLASFVII